MSATPPYGTMTNDTVYNIGQYVSLNPGGGSTATASLPVPRCTTFLQEQRYGRQCSK
jgi:hypothetical protein